MKTARNIILYALIILLYATGGFAAGLLKPVQGGSDSVKMKTHHVDVIINNGFARTQVTQVFVNTGTSDLEAVYSFPVPQNASLSELSLWIDGREVIGEVLAKERAKKVYEEQKAKGNDTAMAEKNDYKTFDVSVSPVRAQAETRIRLVYYQPASVDLNVGRYVYPLEEGGVDEERLSFWSVDSEVTESVSFNLELKSAFPVKDVRLPAYQDQAVIKRAGGNDRGDAFTVALDFPEGASLTKDIVFYYRLQDTVPARLELVPYRSGSHEDGTFMVVVTPGASLAPIQGGTDWTFVLDTSGSMGGEKIHALVDGVSKVVGGMRRDDRFRIVTFSDSAHEFTGGYVGATPENIQDALQKIKGIHAGGGTALYKGLTTAYKGLDSDRTTGIVLVTDGVANVGPRQHSTLVNLLKENDYRLFAFVIGNSANVPLLDALARHSGGFAMAISSSDDIVGRLIQAKSKVLHQCLYDAELSFKGESVYDLTPGDVTNLYMGQQLVLFGKYRHPGDVEVELTGRIGNQTSTWTCKAQLPDVDTENPEIERLWALASIEESMQDIRMKGKSNRRMKRVVDLGTTYSLVTDYTSMVVAREAEMEHYGIDRNNADRVYRERKAQAEKANKPATNYRTDNRSSSSGMFNGSRSHSVGSGPVGPLFVLVALMIRRLGFKNPDK